MKCIYCNAEDELTYDNFFLLVKLIIIPFYNRYADLK